MITRIAENLGVLAGKEVEFLEDAREVIGYDYFFQGHILKKVGEQYYMQYPHGAMIPLPNPDLRLYVVQSFLVNFESEQFDVPRERPRRRAANTNPS